MEELKPRVMSAVLNFLRAELEGGSLKAEDAEGLEVAIQCLETIYDVSNSRQNEPSLTDIYKIYLQNPHLDRREARAEEKARGEALKVEANLAMGDNKYAQALCLYTRAIECDPRNPVYYCNRAAAKSRMNDHHSAVRDCKIAIELDPQYSKAYGRLGLAYCGLEWYVPAVECYQKAHDLDPANEGFKSNLDLAKERVRDLCSQEAQPGPEQASPSDESRPNPLTIDISMLLGNPHLLNIASQVLATPALHSFRNSLAREIPDIVNQFRQTFSPEPPEPGSPQEEDPSHQENE